MKRFQSIGVLLSVITGLLVVLLVSVFAYTARQAYDRRETAVRLLKTVDVLNDVFTASEQLRLQQGAMSTALVQPAPADAATRANIERLHEISDKAFRETHARSIAEADGPVPNLPRIRQAWYAYEKSYAEALANLDKPLAARPAHLPQDWHDSANDMVVAMNSMNCARSAGWYREASQYDTAIPSPNGTTIDPAATPKVTRP